MHEHKEHECCHGEGHGMDHEKIKEHIKHKMEKHKEFMEKIDKMDEKIDKILEKLDSK